jgi:hypothetical protein
MFSAWLEERKKACDELITLSLSRTQMQTQIITNPNRNSNRKPYSDPNLTHDRNLNRTPNTKRNPNPTRNPNQQKDIEFKVKTLRLSLGMWWIDLLVPHHLTPPSRNPKPKPNPNDHNPNTNRNPNRNPNPNLALTVVVKQRVKRNERRR